MSGETVLFEKSWRVGRYTCTLTIRRPKPGAVTCCLIEWDPHQPARLTPAEIAEYRAGRDRALAELSAELGISAAVVEL